MVTRSTLDVPTLANQLHSKHQSACSRVDQCPMLITFSLETYFMFIDLRPRSIRFLVDFAPFCLETSTCYESRYISLCVLDIIVCSRYTNLLLLGKGGWVGRGGGKRALVYIYIFASRPPSIRGGVFICIFASGPPSIRKSVVITV